MELIYEGTGPAGWRVAVEAAQNDDSTWSVVARAYAECGYEGTVKTRNFCGLSDYRQDAINTVYWAVYGWMTVRNRAAAAQWRHKGGNVLQAY